jgi:hypothetical protein
MFEAAEISALHVVEPRFRQWGQAMALSSYIVIALSRVVRAVLSSAIAVLLIVPAIFAAE